VVVERGFASTRYLVRDVLKEAGDAMVLEPDDARVAVRDAAGAIRAGIAPVTAR
jgi:proteasome accessory factor C